jgi:transposase
MAKPLLADELWEVIEPLLPKTALKPKGGRPPLESRPALTGILFVLKTGIPWGDLPGEMGCGSGSTGWRRLRDWQEAGVWERVHQVLLERLRGADKLDLSSAVVDSSSVRAVFGRPRRAQTRPIAARRAAFTMSSPRPTAFRSRFA